MMRGQMGIVNLLYVFVLLVVLSVLFPAYQQVLSQLETYVTDPTVKFLVGLIPLAVVGGVLATIIGMGRTPGYQY